jgi:hypothetical protein
LAALAQPRSLAMLPIMNFRGTCGVGIVVLALALAFSDVHAGAPTPEAVRAIRSKLAAMQKALAAHHGELSEQDERLLQRRLNGAERSFEGYVRLVERGKAREEAKAPLYAAGGVLVADDLSGAGAVDDVLLPFVAFALVVAHVRTLPPPSEQELAVAWGGFLASLQMLTRAVADVAAQRKAGCYCYCYEADEGRYVHKRVSNPLECRDFCRREMKYPGYQCGGAVQWPTN